MAREKELERFQSVWNCSSTRGRRAARICYTNVVRDGAIPSGGIAGTKASWPGA
jgi:hypothetical protein